MNSYTYNQTFSITNAKYLASKISADLKRMQRFYSHPSDSRIDDYEEELIALLKNGYLKKVTYGFKRDGKFIEPSLIYTAVELSNGFETDDDPGRVRPGADVSGASFYSFLTHTSDWEDLSSEERESFEKSISIERSGATEPSIDGHLVRDNTYSSGGKSLTRSTVKSN